ncbi:cobaltochelatase subunit CobN [Shimia marina]|uniref:Aerobic cobaltochelatase subunit CobN n=1 Tax=Shimia marina TaxID=321267 RepID=A0A0P1ES47_9RHOB|nr:cobaltochelatase subunit CobN [Shimia marina]CUH53194.1 Aerobic cobaltochelatase subunit CobN [Shimia marina]SFD82690.1 cobaltochelatase CobN subunit [Shimia marina]
MHVVFRESHGLDEADTPMDLGQTPADLVVLSFSDSDLGAFAAGWHRSNGDLPTLRLANLTALKHPLSVDTYVEQTLSGAKAILIRLIGGISYWQYGIQQVCALAQEKGIALAVLPADGRPDERLDEASTLPVSTLHRLTHLCDTGGAIAAQAALAQLALAAGLYAKPVMGSKTLPPHGGWTPEQGLSDPLQARDPSKPLVAITFYRAYVSSADTAPIEAMFAEFRARGFDVIGLFAPSLKVPDSAKWLAQTLQDLQPAAIVNATSFSGKGDSGTSPLDATEAPVFQVALATSRKKAWAESERGLAPSDLAMHVVLPEVDGRLFAGVSSFKEPGKKDPALEYSRFAHHAQPERIRAVADKVERWIALGAKDNQNKQIACVLSTYPGKDWNMAHAVGLDPLASVDAIIQDLDEAGFDVSQEAQPALQDALLHDTLSWPLEDYVSALEKLPASLQGNLTAAWGTPSDDPSFADGSFHFKAVRRGKLLIALQPERGSDHLREDEYHDLSRVPRHSYVAFYLWLREMIAADALIHVGAHGTLEWLPGKSVALSETCWPEALIGDLPVVYPFIVNDPGEAAQAKRRINALTLGHVPPPLKTSATPQRFARLETLLDEFSNADGLDPKRRDRLQSDIRDEADALGLQAELGLDEATCLAEAITRIDTFVCDIKESQFGDGLHVYGRPPKEAGSFDAAPSAKAERSALLRALSGKRIEAGPSGSPYRGRNDVLPTGRNLFTTDPRSVPSRSAYAQGVKLAEELVRRHLQEEGDYPKNLIVDLWGSATMRTAGEEFAMALHLLGAKPVWDEGSERVSGVEILPIALLDRPRVDVTLRVSGLFRDVFPTLSTLFGQAVKALAERDEAADWNPFAGRITAPRVYGPAPGSYGLGMGSDIENYSDEGRKAAGEAWLNASSYAFDGDKITRDAAGIRDRVSAADSFVHLQDLPETDVLVASDYAAHEAGFAAAQKITGGQANLYHVDNTNPEAPRARSLTEEIARVVHARATNPDWLAGMMRHGFRGGAEIAATLDHMGAFANLAGAVPPQLFDAYHDATLGNEDIVAFLERENPQALAAMRDRFAALHAAGLWVTRRNSILANLEQAS